MISECDILIVGGGTGGTAAALAALSLGQRVVLTEETDWIGGQLTSQAVPPDENRWIELFGCTRRYRSFRNGVRAYYRDHYPLTSAAREEPQFNPGGGYVSRLCCEPRVALAVLEQMLAFHRASGALDLRLCRKPVKVETNGDKIAAVHLLNTHNGETETVAAPYILDATELGDLLALGGVEYVSGAEARSETGEKHAAEVADPENVQALTWCFPMGYDPDGDHVIAKPEQYDFWRDYAPDLHPVPWSGKLLDWMVIHPVTLEHRWDTLFEKYYNWWNYRRIIQSTPYVGKKIHEVTIVNWPQNDYLLINPIDKSEDTVQKAYHGAKQLSLSLLYWMQTEAPRADGGVGHPGLYLRPDITGTEDGLAKAIYVRESRRIKAEFTVTEAHVGKEMLEDSRQTTAVKFHDSVGIGSYRIDLHPSTGGDNYIDISSLPFQIPLGALIPQRVENLLPACKNLGVTHITNGCYRLHPVEWNIGEAAGLLAAFCLERKLTPRQVRNTDEHLKDFQRLLREQGAELEWPELRAV